MLAVAMPGESSALSEPMQPETSPAPAVGRLVEQLILLSSMLKELETQSHLVHLNFEGENFLQVHEFLKGQYEAHLEQFDRVAELVRSMDYWMPLCSCGLKDALAGFQHICSHEGRAMLLTYYSNIEAMGYLAKELERVAGEVGAPDVQNYMADLVGFAFKTSWFLKAMLRGC
jgi:DNA-binding ferritin-like protein